MNGPINKGVSSALPRVFSRRSAILKIVEEKALGTRLTTSTKAMCAWDSGLVIVLDTVEVMTPTQAGIQCPGSLLKKFLNLRLRSRDKHPFLHKRL